MNYERSFGKISLRDLGLFARRFIGALDREGIFDTKDVIELLFY